VQAVEKYTETKMFTKKLNKAVSYIGRYLCNFRGKRFAEEIERIVDLFHRGLNNVNFDIERNGELRVLMLFSKFKPTCFFDIGANKGSWSQMVSEMNPSSIIHAFEIVPSTYKELVENTKSLENIKPNGFGLSNKEETIPVFLGKDSETATGHKIEGMSYHNQYYIREIYCKTRKACDYMNEQNIDFIDYVKIDVEGMELQVLQGFEDRIKDIRVIQFEYGIFNISSHALLADFCRFLREKGFVVGKIFPKHVKFFDYHFDMENFHGSNYLAVRNHETLLIERLQG